jgi:hypothetical protein
MATVNTPAVDTIGASTQNLPISGVIAKSDGVGTNTILSAPISTHGAHAIVVTTFLDLVAGVTVTTTVQGWDPASQSFVTLKAGSAVTLVSSFDVIIIDDNLTVNTQGLAANTFAAAQSVAHLAFPLPSAIRTSTVMSGGGATSQFHVGITLS